MNNPTPYRMISHLDKPKRFMSFTMDELMVALVGLMLLVASNHKVLVGLFSVTLLSTLKHFKHGQGPRFLLVQLYWYLPRALSQVFVVTVPPSHLRLWRG